MRVRLNNRKQIRINTGNVKVNLCNETRIKLPGTPGTGGGGTPTITGFDYTLDFGFQ